MLLVGLDVKQFVAMEEFFEEADRFVNHVKSSPPAEGVDAVLLPGEIERNVLEQSTREGIFVDAETWRQILGWGEKLGVELETPD